MKYVVVKFRNEDGSFYHKEYIFKTKLDLHPGYEYRIRNEINHIYANPCLVMREAKKSVEDVRQITLATCVKAPKCADDNVKIVNFDEAKGITVVRWIDNSVTKVTCCKGEVFDKEKGLALCYMKKYAFNNRGCFNKTLRKYCHEEK